MSCCSNANNRPRSGGERFDQAGKGVWCRQSFRKIVRVISVAVYGYLFDILTKR